MERIKKCSIYVAFFYCLFCVFIICIYKTNCEIALIVFLFSGDILIQVEVPDTKCDGKYFLKNPGNGLPKIINSYSFLMPFPL